MTPLVCVDVGSTWTKAAAISPRGQLVARAQHPTTAGTDVLEGLDAAVAALGLGAVGDDRVLACSSAGGGLRLAVVGQERVVSGEAGRRVALSAGARVVRVLAGALGPDDLAELRGAAPDIVLLVGGTDGGDTEVLLHNARALAAEPPGAAVVLAGNVDARDRARRGLAHGGWSVTTAANVIPRIGHLNPGPARVAIRAAFLTHVIGGTGLSAGPRFPALVRCATPDAVLAGVEVLAEVVAARATGSGEVLAVDVGGATTDVFSVRRPDDRRDQVVEPLWHGRSVEADLGVRWSAPDTVAAATAERLTAADPELDAAARRRAAHPGSVPTSSRDQDADLLLARLAVTVALRRHARGGSEPPRDLSRVELVVGSGGALRHAPAGAGVDLLAQVCRDHAGGWRLPSRPGLVIDAQYVLAPTGLLALTGRRGLARRLVASLLPAGTVPEPL